MRRRTLKIKQRYEMKGPVMTLRETGTSERMGTELSDETRIQTRETGIHVSVSKRAIQNSKMI